MHDLQCRNDSFVMGHGVEMTHFLKCICHIFHAWKNTLRKFLLKVFGTLELSIFDCWSSALLSVAVCGKEAFLFFSCSCCANNRKAVCVCDYSSTRLRPFTQLSALLRCVSGSVVFPLFVPSQVTFSFLAYLSLSLSISWHIQLFIDLIHAGSLGQ